MNDWDKEQLYEALAGAALVFALFVTLFFVAGCFAKPPVVIERSCHFVGPKPKSKLPPVKFAKEGCPYYRCLDEENAEKMKQREIRLRGDSNYMRELYLKTKERCEN